jgi:hypothetical protein
VRKLDILGVIERGGAEAARTVLGRALAKTSAVPELSAGLIPLLEAQGIMRRVRVVRSSPLVRERLREHYGYLFTENDRFLDIEDPDVIDVTTFTFGFPAAALHFLQESRLAGQEVAPLPSGEPSEAEAPQGPAT